MTPDCDTPPEESMAEETLCAEPSLILLYSSNGVLLTTLVIFLNLQKMSTTSLRWTLMLTLAYVFTKDTLELDPSSAALSIFYAIGAMHLPMMPRKVALGSLALAAFMHYEATSGGGILGKGVLIGFLTCAAAVASLARLWALAVTMKATMALTMVFPLVSRLFPSFTFGDDYFFRADGCPPDIAAKRKAGFDRLCSTWAMKWPKSKALALELKASFSDLRFASGNRVFLPFNRLLDDALDPATVVSRSEGIDLIDIDNQRLMDISGSYGVNVCGTERYKKFLKGAIESVGDLGLVLGPVHPLLAENIKLLKTISRKQEVSFHMSGTEAVMAAVRLCRFNMQNRKLVAVFGGSYHGWWDGVQPSAGNARAAYDLLTLNDLDPWALKAIALRAGELACVVVNPLQAFHPNKPPPSDLVLLSNSRAAGSQEDAYQKWLVKLAATCKACGVPLVYDEVYTGFRLAPGGAQDYYQVEADVVVYGKTLGGGMPCGVVCGPSKLMNRNNPNLPLNVAYVIGTFSAAPLTVACMHQFLTWVLSKEATTAYDEMRVRVRDWVVSMNNQLEAAGYPLRVASYSSVWTMLFTQPGRYHWYLQYLLRDEGVQLSWVGTGRLNFSLDFDDAALALLSTKMLAACQRMSAEGWWHPVASPKTLGLRTGIEIARGFAYQTVFGKALTLHG